MTDTPDAGAVSPLALQADRSGVRSWRLSAAEVRAAVVLLVALALVGLVAGLIWAHVAPRALYTVVDVKQRLAQQNNPESEAQVGTDAWFALIGAGVGLITGAVAWRWRSARGPFLMFMLAAASLLGAVIAWRFGLWVGRHPTQSQLQPIFDKVDNTFRPAIKMRAKAVLFFQPVGAIVAALISVGFAHDSGTSSKVELPAGASEAVDEGLVPLSVFTETTWLGDLWPDEHKRLTRFPTPHPGAGEALSPGWFIRSPWPSLTTEQSVRLVETYVPHERTPESAGRAREVLGWSEHEAHTAFQHVASRFKDE